MKKFIQTFSLLLFALLGTHCATKAQEQSQRGDDSSQGRDVMTTANFRTSSGGAVNWEARLDNKYFVRNGNKKEIYVYVELQGGENKQDKAARAPLNLSLVVDRSGSMSGDKLAYAKKAMDFVIDQLGSEDYLSMVEYDDNVNVLQPSEMVLDSKRILHQKVAKIREGGSTNLCGGMQQGYVQVRATKKQGYINRVLLLSDGIVTAGISDSKQITKIAENHFKENGVAISTFGVGADYNENLMTDISEAGGANYYFIGNPEQIPNIFAKELQGLLAVVGQSVKLKVKFPTKNLRCVKAYGYPFTVFGDEVFVDFNDVFAKEEKGVLLKFEVIEPFSENLSFDCEMRYTDIATKKEHADNQKLMLSITGDEKLFGDANDLKVKENIVLFESTEMFDEALKEADKGNYEKAKELSGKTTKYLESNKSEAFSPRFEQQQSNVTKYDKEVETMKSRPVEEQQMMQKSSKSSNYEMKKKK